VTLIAGVDEVGVGPLAGPVVAAAVVFKKGYKNRDIRDSKKLSPKIREQLTEVIKNDCVYWSIVAVGSRRIDSINIRQARKLAMSYALLRVKAESALIDGNMLIDTQIPQTTVIGGDDKHVEIAAASVIAKVWRDELMRQFDLKYQGYGFANNMGYPTREHQQAIARLGPTVIHRQTFKGVREYVPARGEKTEILLVSHSKPV